MPSLIQGIIVAQAVPGNAGIALMARVRNVAGNLWTQASLTSISYGVSDVDQGTTLVASTSLTVANVVYDSLQQNDALWTKDSAEFPGADGSYGYNFKTVLAATAVPIANSGDTIQVDVVCTPTSGAAFRLVFRFPTVKVFI